VDWMWYKEPPQKKNTPLGNKEKLFKGNHMMIQVLKEFYFRRRREVQQDKRNGFAKALMT
jgi:hypothetical protein